MDVAIQACLSKLLGHSVITDSCIPALKPLSQCGDGNAAAAAEGLHSRMHSLGDKTALAQQAWLGAAHTLPS